MVYASTAQIEAGFRDLDEDEARKAAALLEEAAIMIDAVAREAPEEAKQLVSCRMVRRALSDGDGSIPLGATQGTTTAGPYSQTWTVGSAGSTGELYLGKADRQLLGIGNRLGASNPYEGRGPERD